jgi:hypothetical protein
MIHGRALFNGTTDHADRYDSDRICLMGQVQ